MARLWAGRIGFAVVLAQALFFALTLIWPRVAAPSADAVLAVALARTALWQASALPLLTLLALPLMAWWVWAARGGAARVLALLALAATVALFAVMVGEYERVARLATAQDAAAAAVRRFDFSRWGTFMLGLFALLALRLSRRADAA